MVFEAVGITKAERSVPVEKKYENMFLTEGMTERMEQESAVVGDPDANGKVQIGGKKTALLITAYNRPQYLLKTVNQVIHVLSAPRNKYTVDVVVSQDGYDQGVKLIIENIGRRFASELPWISLVRTTHKRDCPERETVYNCVSSHLFSSLDQLFQKQKYDQVILLDVRLFPLSPL